MLGRIAGKPFGQLVGDIHHPEVSVYQATEYREKSVEESLELIRRDVAEYDARALKIKVGGLMFMTTDINAVGPQGRTETIIPLVRKTFGDGMALYADANGFYSVEEAIRVGRLLEEYRYGFFEEPVMFDWYEETKQVADALTLPIAGGEQEYSLHGFRWLIANDAPRDRSARHLLLRRHDPLPAGGADGRRPSGRPARRTCPAAGSDSSTWRTSCRRSRTPRPHHEFKGLRTNVPFECRTSPLKVADGRIKVPTGPGFGVEIDPAFVAKHRPVTA